MPRIVSRRGAPQAYDQHLNMILGEVEETITTVEYDEDTYEEHVKVSVRTLAACRPRAGPLLLSRRGFGRERACRCVPCCASI